MPRSAFRLGLAGVFALWLAAVVWYHHAQKPVSQNGGYGWDGGKYHHMYLEVQRGERFAEEKPYVYRVASPWVAAHLGLADARLAFHAVNLAGVLLTGLLLFCIMSCLGASPGISLFLVGTFFLQWHGPLRQQFYDSFTVDAPSQPFTCLVFLAYLAMGRSRNRLLVLSLVTFIGVFFRESVIFATLATGLAEAVEAMREMNGMHGKSRVMAILRDRAVRSSALPLLAGIVGIAITHLMGDGGGPYSFLNTILYYLYHKPLMVLIHAFYNGYGTALIPVLVFWRKAWASIRERPILGIYPLITFALGWTAGGDTTRINYWGCLALLPLMALVLSDLKLTTFGIGSFLALEILTTRMLFAIPDYPGPEHWRIPFLTNWGSDIPVFDLWSELANPRVLMISLFQYLALTAFAFLWMHWIGLEKFHAKPSQPSQPIPPQGAPQPAPQSAPQPAQQPAPNQAQAP